MKRSIWILALACALVAGLSACKKEEEGTMEKMGKAVDSAVHDTRDAVEEAAEEVEEAAEDAKD